jgi:hypothetical protein
MRRLSAVDAISPAFTHTGRQLFRPLRFGLWLRLSIVALATGEFGGSTGGSSFNLPSSPPAGREEIFSYVRLLQAETDPWKILMPLLPWILLAIVALVGVGLIWIYVASVYRFVLLESVLYGRCELRAGWTRWQRHGGSFFLWQIGFGLASLTALAILVGGPVLWAWRRGVFKQPDAHTGLLIGGVLVLLVLFLGWLLVNALADLFARDFVVPLMALEDVRVLSAWGRFFSILGAEKGAFTGYVLMKIVLAIGSAILFGIAGLIALLVSLIPLGLVGVVVWLLVSSLGLSWNLYTVGLAVMGFIVALGAVLWVVSFVYVPGLVFFQAYALRFLGSRHAGLDAVLNPPAPEAVPPAPAAPPATAPAT